MPITSVAVEDKITGGPPKRNYRLDLPADRISIRELIRAYVSDQVRKLSGQELPASANFESDEERALNPRRETRRGKEYDCDAEFDKALKAFSSNNFFVIVDGKQVEELDQEVKITPETTVSFLKLVPLVGG